MAEGRKQWPEVADGWFVEPPGSTHFLLTFERFDGGVWDPCCGQGNIITACRLDGYDNSIGTDLRTRVPDDTEWWGGEADFFATRWRHSIRPNIISNPPYGRAKLMEAFIRKSLKLKGLEKLAVFANSKFLFGSGRAQGLWADHPPDRIYPVFPRPSCPPGVFLQSGGKAKGGVENFVWLVFDLKEPTGRTEFIWAGRAGVGTSDHHRPTPPDLDGE